MNPYEIISSVIITRFPDHQLLWGGAEDINRVRTQNQDVSYPLIWFNKESEVSVSVDRNGAIRNTMRVLLAVFYQSDQPSDVTLAEQDRLLEQSLQDANQLFAYIRAHPYIARFPTQIQPQTANLLPDFYRFAAHLIGCGLEFDLSYYPNVRLC